MFDVGDIISLFAPTVGYNKYHLCILPSKDQMAGLFLWLNSDPGFRSACDIKCERVPCIPASRTGFTCFSFGVVLRYNDRQLRLYQAKKLGVIDPILAAELEKFASDPRNVRGLTGEERPIVLKALGEMK